MAELFGVFGMLKNERALNICAAVASAGKLEMPGADCSDLFEKFQNVVTLHCSPPPWLRQRLPLDSWHSLNAETASVNANSTELRSGAR